MTSTMTTEAAGTGPSPLPAPPGLLRSLRAALSDLVAHSWRLVVLNLAWAAAVVLIVAAAAVVPWAWLLTPLAAIPTAGVYRVAALIVRDEPVSIAQGFAAWKDLGGRAVLVGSALLIVAVILTANLVSGLRASGVLGWSLATFAGWGLAATGVMAAIVWPLLADPRRAGAGLRDIVRLAGLLALAYPLRFGALALILLAWVALGTLAIVMVLSVSIGIAALVACHYVLPAADRFEARFGASGSGTQAS